MTNRRRHWRVGEVDLPEGAMTKQPFKITRRDDRVPKCPYCERDLGEVHVRSKGLGFVVARSAVYFCPGCRKVLGVGPSRMV